MKLLCRYVVLGFFWGFLGCSLSQTNRAPQGNLNYRAIVLPEEVPKLKQYIGNALNNESISAAQYIRAIASISKKKPQSIPLGGLPFFFEKNTGQAESRVQYLARRPNYGLYFTEGEIIAAFLDDERVREAEISAVSQTGGTKNIGDVLTFSLIGAQTSPLKPDGISEVPLRVIKGPGADTEYITSQVPSLLRMKNVYRGVDLVYFGENYQLHYAFEIDPMAAIPDIRWKISGADKMSLTNKGDLVIRIGKREIRQTAPIAFEKLVDGTLKRFDKAAFHIVARDTVAIEISGPRTPGAQLFIDPILVFATYFGGSGEEASLSGDSGAAAISRRGIGVALGVDGRSYLTGKTTSADLPATDGSSLSGAPDVFVAALESEFDGANAVLSLSYVTYLGGSGGDHSRSIVALNDGSVYLTGHSTSIDFPVSEDVVNPAREECGGFLVKLSPTGAFLRGTYVGETCGYHPNAIAYEAASSSDSAPRVYVAGTAYEQGSDIPSLTTANSYQAQNAGERDAFVAVYRPNLDQIVYATFVGGSNNDNAMDLAVRNGVSYITGSTASADFPTTPGAFQSTLASSQTGCTPSSQAGFVLRRCFDSFVTKISADGSALGYSTYYGYSDEDFARGIGVDSSGRAVFTGQVRSRISTGGIEMFVTQLETDGQNLSFETFKPGNGIDGGEDLSVDISDRIHVVGTTSKEDLASLTPEQIQSEFGGATDMYYWRLSPQGDTEFFTYYGGSGTEIGYSIDVVSIGSSGDANICVLLGGASSSAGLSTPGAISDGPTGPASDALIALLCDVFLAPVPLKLASTAEVQPGDLFTYIISLTNPGDDPLTDITLTDQFAPQLQVMTVIPPSCTVGNNILSCPSTTIAGASTFAASIIVQVRDNVPECSSISNVATFSSMGFSADTAAVQVRTVCPPNTGPGTPNLCGNGVVDALEACDTGVLVENGSCSADCTHLILCGDGVIGGNEECDDGGSTSFPDRCNSQCKSQLDSGDLCGSDTANCRDGLVCGKTCSIGGAECDVVIIPFLLCLSSGDSQYCRLPECMTPGNGVIEVPV